MNPIERETAMLGAEPLPRYHLTYLELDSWDYWTMSAPVRDTTVITARSSHMRAATWRELRRLPVSGTARRRPRFGEDVQTWLSIPSRRTKTDQR